VPCAMVFLAFFVPERMSLSHVVGLPTPKIAA